MRGSVDRSKTPQDIAGASLNLWRGSSCLPSLVAHFMGCFQVPNEGDRTRGRQTWSMEDRNRRNIPCQSISSSVGENIFNALYSQQDKSVDVTFFFLKRKILLLEQHTHAHTQNIPLDISMLYHCCQLLLCLTNDLIIFLFPPRKSRVSSPNSTET